MCPVKHQPPVFLTQPGSLGPAVLLVNSLDLLVRMPSHLSCRCVRRPYLPYAFTSPAIGRASFFVKVVPFRPLPPPHPHASLCVCPAVTPRSIRLVHKRILIFDDHPASSLPSGKDRTGLSSRGIGKNRQTLSTTDGDEHPTTRRILRVLYVVYRLYHTSIRGQESTSTRVRRGWTSAGGTDSPACSRSFRKLKAQTPALDGVGGRVCSAGVRSPVLRTTLMRRQVCGAAGADRKGVSQERQMPQQSWHTIPVSSQEEFETGIPGVSDELATNLEKRRGAPKSRE